jgi:DNA-binding LytR/AlgR family response regulator
MSGWRIDAPEQSHSGLRVVVVEPGDGGGLVRLLGANPAVADLHTAGDVMGAVRLLQSVEADVVFAGVGLTALDGFDLARIVSQFAWVPMVVLVAADGRRAAEAFEVGAVDYLLRPVSAPRLAESLRRVPGMARAATGSAPGASVAQRIPAADELVPVTVGGMRTRVARSTVRWLEAHRGYTRLHTSGASYPVNDSLVNLARAWAEDGFVQIHRSYAVRLTAVTELRRAAEHLSVVVDGHELPVSRRFGQQVRHLLLAGAPMRARRAAAAA